MKRTILGLFACWLTYGQPPNPSLSFEVASVKLSPPFQGGVGGGLIGCRGGPGTEDPGQYTCAHATIGTLLIQAFSLKPYQLPSVSRDAYQVTAKVPAGATKEQLRTMLQNLLVERFKLTWHFEKKEMEIYTLVVGKGGLKLKEPSLEYRSSQSRINGGLSFSATAWTMDQLAQFLSLQLRQPVNDATGLNGKYDFTLTYAADGIRPALTPPPESDAPTLFTAVQGLGLKLDQKKGPIDVLVIDHMEKNPTEN